MKVLKIFKRKISNGQGINDEKFGHRQVSIRRHQANITDPQVMKSIRQLSYLETIS